MANFTSGNIVTYQKFSFDLHLKRFSEDLSKILLRPSAYDCIAKVRCGAGLQCDLTLGHFVKTEAGDLKYAYMNSEQTFGVTFLYDSKLPENEKISFQCAVLYTTAEGQLRIRLHNLSLPCTNDIANVFKMADLDALVNFQTKQIASQYTDQPLPFLANQVSTKCTHVLAAYRKHCASSMSSGQLVLPDALKLLPLYSSCLLKQPGFLTSNFTAVSLCLILVHRYGTY